MKKAVVLLTALLLPLASFAADAATPEEVFQRYWHACANKEAAKAAGDILPSDLDDLKSAVLPVMLATQAPKDKNAQEFSAAFFNKIVGSARAAMSSTEVFAGFQRIVAASNPDMSELLKTATLSVIFVRNTAPDDVEVHYQVTIRGESEVDAELLTKKNGRWWVRLKEDPKQLAEQFKQILNGPPQSATAK
jgi:hypothetical protein